MTKKNKRFLTNSNYSDYRHMEPPRVDMRQVVTSISKHYPVCFCIGNANSMVAVKFIYFYFYLGECRIVLSS